MSYTFIFLVLGLCGAALAMHIQPFSDTETSFYDLCSRTESVKCAGAWKSELGGACLEARNCSKAAAMEATDAGLVFHMIATNNVAYMALGFSMDASMGDDPVVACVRDENDTITGALSYNVRFSNVRAESDEVLNVQETSFENGIIYCRFSLVDTLRYARHFDNNTDSDFYLIAAAGNLEADGRLGHHSGRIVSDEKWSFGPRTTFDDFYNMCLEENVRCAGAWSKSESEAGACFASRNCTKALAMEDTDEGQVFHLLATTDVKYIALGFSEDTGMGDDAVVACVKNGTEVSGALSYNVGFKNMRSESNAGLTLHEAKMDDGAIYCKFSLEDTVKYARHLDNNTDNQFYVIGVSGSLEADGRLGHHSGHIVSDEKWTLNSGVALTSSVLVLITAAAITVTGKL